MADLGPKAPCAVVVLAAGKGTRMKSTRPKVLHALAGRPMLAWLLDAIGHLTPTHVVGVVGPGMDEVAAVFAPHPTVVQDPQLGTGHAVRQAETLLGGFAGDVLVVYGDTPLLTAGTLDAMRTARHAPADPAVVVLGFRPADPAAYGRLIVSEDGTLDAIVEHADADPAHLASDLCNSGVMAIDGGLLFGLLGELGNDNAKGEYYLTDIVALARKAGRGCAVVEGGAEELLGVNDRADLAAAEAVIQERLRADAMVAGATLIDPASTWLSHDTRLGRDVIVGPQVFFGPGVHVEDGVQIHSFCHLERVRIASGSTVGPFARIRGDTVVGEGVRIGNFVEAKAATIEAGAKVSHLSYIGDARVGAAANIGAGTITCNYDGFTKSHTDIGKGAFIGSNSALVAPVKIGDDAIVAAGSVIGRDVEPDALAITRAKQENKAAAAKRFRAARSKSKSKS